MEQNIVQVFRMKSDVSHDQSSCLNPVWLCDATQYDGDDDMHLLRSTKERNDRRALTFIQSSQLQIESVNIETHGDLCSVERFVRERPCSDCVSAVRLDA